MASIGVRLGYIYPIDCESGRPLLGSMHGNMSATNDFAPVLTRAWDERERFDLFLHPMVRGLISLGPALCKCPILGDRGGGPHKYGLTFEASCCLPALRWGQQLAPFTDHYIISI